MNRDNVSVAFDVVLEEIAAVEDQLTEEGQAAFRGRRFDDAKKLGDAGNKLLDFRGKLEALRQEWTSGVDVETRERVRLEPIRIEPNEKGPRTGLRVKLRSGRIIQRSTAALTLADVVEELGIDLVKSLGLRVNNVPLVDVKKHPRYNQVERGRYFIITHSNTQSKKDLIEKISSMLGEAVEVAIV